MYDLTSRYIILIRDALTDLQFSVWLGHYRNDSRAAAREFESS